VARRAIDRGEIALTKFVKPEIWEGPRTEVMSLCRSTVKAIIKVSYRGTMVAITYLLGLPLCDGVEDIGDDD
jgi:hypothetical protein